MNRLLSLLLIPLFLLAFTACGSDDDNEVQPPVVTNCVNTVFVYMPWTGNSSGSSSGLLSNLRQNIRDIKRTIIKGEGNADATRTIVFLASGASSARLFEIKSDTTESTIGNYDNGVMTSTDDLAQLLNTVAQAAGTKTYSILIGAHASGWLPAASETYMSRSFGGMNRSLRTDITTLASAIGQSSIKKVEYVCFDDCYMANIETAYALRNVANWLVASTSEIMEQGLPYADIWKYLSSTSVNYSAIVNGFYDYYSTNKEAPYGSLSAIDCSKAEEMASLMKDFNKSITAIGDYDPSRVQALDGFSPHVFYDMGSYLRDMCGQDTVAYKPLFDELKALVPYYCCTPELITDMFYSDTYPVKSFSGITISDPSLSSYAVNAKKETEWWQATH